MKRPHIISKILFAAFGCFASGQSAAQYECSIKNFNTENGLPQNEITAMTMDYDGYLWLGTRSGLVRYDGINLKTFIINKNGNEIANTVSYLMNIPLEKKMMVKILGSRVLSIQDGRPVLYTDSVFGPGGWAPVFGDFPTMSLYQKFYKSIFYRFLDEKFHPDLLDILPINDTDFIAGRPERDELIYFKGKEKQEIIRMGVNLKKFISTRDYHFLIDEQNTMYLFDKSINHFRKINIDWKSIQRTNINISDAVFYSDQYSGESVCFYNSTLYLLNFDASHNLIRFIPQFSIKDKTHFWTGVTYDSTHSTFFLSTLNEGFFQVKLKKIQTFDVNATLPKDVDPGNTIYYTLLKTSDSTAVIPTGFQFTSTTSGVKIKKLGNLFGERETLGLLNNNDILSTHNGKLYRHSSKDRYEIEQSFNDSFNRITNGIQVQVVYPEGDSVWASTNDAVFCFKKNKTDIVFDKTKNKTDSNYCEWDYFYRINKEEVFISNIYGLYRFHTTAPYKMEAIPELKGKLVRTFSPYKNAFILAAYNYGLYVYEDSKLYKVPLPESLPELAKCEATYIDNNGNIWISTTKGLFRSTASSLVESAVNRENIPLFFYYGKDDGIVNIEFSGGGNPPYAVLSDERLLLPSRGGIVSFKPRDLNEKIINTPVFVESVSANNKKIEKSKDSINLQSDFKFLVIELSSPNLGDPKNLFIEFKLDNEEWKELNAADNMKITLTDISSGNHHLLIRKRTGFGNADYVYSSLNIYKEKSIYERVWFYLAIVLLIALIAWFFSKWQTRSINIKRKKLQKLVNEQTAELSKAGEVKDMLISIISHDMITPLRYISVSAGALAKRFEKSHVEEGRALSDIQLTTDKIVSGSLDIVNWIKYSKKINVEKKQIDLHKLVDETLVMYMPIAENKNIHLDNQVQVQQLINVDRTIFTTILTNLISNSIKYTASGKIIVSTDSSIDGTKTVLRVSDTGNGMSKEVLSNVNEMLKGNLYATGETTRIGTGLGYVMISELAKIHDIEVTVESEMNKGTIVSLFVS